MTNKYHRMLFIAGDQTTVKQIVFAAQAPQGTSRAPSQDVCFHGMIKQSWQNKKLDFFVD